MGGALELRSVTFAFGQRTVLDRISLSVSAGECVALLGANGSGKTTLLRLAAGLLRPLSGEVFVAGSPASAGRADVGLAFQDARLLDWRSALRNVTLPLELARMSIADARVVASEALARVSATAIADRSPNELSGGQRQRVALARALVRRPSLILLDEPFAALDAPTRGRLDEELPELIGGAAALFVTHDVAEALLVADRVLLLSDRGVIGAEVAGFRSLPLAERRRALRSTDGLAVQTSLLAVLNGAVDA